MRQTSQDLLGVASRRPDFVLTPFKGTCIVACERFATEISMGNRKWVQSLSGVVLFGLGLGTGLVAQTSTDSPQRVEQKRADLTGAPGMEVIASLIEIKPGETSDLHFHHGVEAFHVLQGARIQEPGKDPTMLPTGL